MAWQQAEVDEPDATMSVDAESRRDSVKLSRALFAAKHNIHLRYTIHRQYRQYIHCLATVCYSTVATTLKELRCTARMAFTWSLASQECRRKNCVILGKGKDRQKGQSRQSRRSRQIFFHTLWLLTNLMNLMIIPNHSESFPFAHFSAARLSIDWLMGLHHWSIVFHVPLNLALCKQLLSNCWCQILLLCSISPRLRMGWSHTVTIGALKFTKNSKTPSNRQHVHFSLASNDVHIQ